MQSSVTCLVYVIEVYVGLLEEDGDTVETALIGGPLQGSAALAVVGVGLHSLQDEEKHGEGLLSLGGTVQHILPLVVDHVDVRPLGEQVLHHGQTALVGCEVHGGEAIVIPAVDPVGQDILGIGSPGQDAGLPPEGLDDQLQQFQLLGLGEDVQEREVSLVVDALYLETVVHFPF